MQTFRIEKTETQCNVTWRHYSRSGVREMLLAGALFTIFSAFCTYFSLTERELVLSALFFWGFVFAIIGVVIVRVYGSTRLALDEAGLGVIWTCLFFKSEKHVALTEIHQFVPYILDVYVAGLPKKQRFCKLRVVCNESLASLFALQNDFSDEVRYKNVDFKTPISESNVHELDELCGQLNTFLEQLQGSGVPAK